MVRKSFLRLMVTSRLLTLVLVLVRPSVTFRVLGNRRVTLIWSRLKLKVLGVMVMCRILRSRLCTFSNVLKLSPSRVVCRSSGSRVRTINWRTILKVAVRLVLRCRRVGSTCSVGRPC